MIVMKNELDILCKDVRKSIDCKEYARAAGLICTAMSRYPHAAQPHNLMGILEVTLGNHALAMNHFRAAWSLDPTYMPARRNLENLGTFCGKGAFTPKF